MLGQTQQQRKLIWNIVLELLVGLLTILISGVEIVHFAVSQDIYHIFEENKK